MLQPLDISVNRSFKAVLRRLWESWMSEGEHNFTKMGRMRRAEFGEVAKWVSEAWDSISEKSDCIRTTMQSRTGSPRTHDVARLRRQATKAAVHFCHALPRPQQ